MANVSPQQAIDQFARHYTAHITNPDGSVNAFALAEDLRNLTLDFQQNGRYTKPHKVAGFTNDPSAAPHQAAAIRKFMCNLIYREGEKGINRSTTSRAGSTLNALIQPQPDKGNKKLFDFAASTNIRDESYHVQNPARAIGQSLGFKAVQSLYKYSLAIIADEYISPDNAGTTHQLFLGQSPEDRLAKLAIMHDMINHGALDPKSPHDARLSNLIKGCGQYAVDTGDSSFYDVARSALTDRKDVRALDQALGMTYNDDIERKNFALQSLVGNSAHTAPTPRNSYISFDNPLGQRNRGGMMVPDPLLTAIQELGRLTQDKPKSAELINDLYDQQKKPELARTLINGPQVKGIIGDGGLKTTEFVDVNVAFGGNDLPQEFALDILLNGGRYIGPTFAQALAPNASPRSRFLALKALLNGAKTLVLNPIHWGQKTFGD